MIAEIHGKISSTGSNLSDRPEDQLTGDVFGTLRYIDARAGLLPFLASSYFLTNDGKRVHPSNFRSAIIKQIGFWPWIVQAEPDVLIELELDGNQGGMVLIEAKYHSTLSRDDTTDAPVLEHADASFPVNLQQNYAFSPKESRNQLIRQMRGMKTMYPGLRRVQIFLTTDRIYPSEILSRVRRRADTKTEGLDDTELYWLSWHDLPAILRQSCKSGAWLSEREKIIVSDLPLLCERKGLARFSRLELYNCAVPNSCRLVVRTPLNETPMPIPIQTSDVPKAIPSLIPIACLAVPRTQLAVYQ